MRPKFVFFDLGNVLLHFDHQLATRRLSALTGVSESVVHNALFASGLQHDYESGLVTTDECHRRFVQLADCRIGLLDFAAAISDIFSLNWQIRPIVTQLARSHVSTGVLSNTCSAHWEWVANRRYPFLRRDFSVHVLSFQVGSMKPDLQIYRSAEARVVEQASDIFFVDDRRENVAAAAAAGWDAVQFQSVQQLARELSARGLPVGV